jgi:hypothetical protein
MFGTGIGAADLLLRFIQRQKQTTTDDAFATETTVRVVYSRKDMLKDIILFAFLAVAIYVASQCGNDVRQYAGAILEPYVYLIVRLIVPCQYLTRGTASFPNK